MFADPILVTGEDFRFLVQDQVADIKRDASLVLIEPSPRDTAPAILAATLAMAADAPDALILVLPSDHAILEKVDNVVVQPFNAHWSDMGSWDAIWQGNPHTDDDVATVGGALDVGSENSLLYRDAGAPTLIGMGLTNTSVVATKDAVLVADRAQVQNVKHAVDQLSGLGEATATQTPRVYRPWGPCTGWKIQGRCRWF